MNKNKQKMFYANPQESKPIYETDEFGNIKYIEVDGEMVPVETGEYTPSITMPKEFKANINGKLNDVIIRAFGADSSDNHAQIVADKNVLPFEIGTRIWLRSKVEYTDSEKTIPDIYSADYRVDGVLREGLNEDMFYLTVLNHESKNEGEENGEQES